MLVKRNTRLLKLQTNAKYVVIQVLVTIKILLVVVVVIPSTVIEDGITIIASGINRRSSSNSSVVVKLAATATARITILIVFEEVAVNPNYMMILPLHRRCNRSRRN